MDNEAIKVIRSRVAEVVPDGIDVEVYIPDNAPWQVVITLKKDGMWRRYSVSTESVLRSVDSTNHIDMLLLRMMEELVDAGIREEVALVSELSILISKRLNSRANWHILQENEDTLLFKMTFLDATASTYLSIKEAGPLVDKTNYVNYILDRLLYLLAKELFMEKQWMN